MVNSDIADFLQLGFFRLIAAISILLMGLVVGRFLGKLIERILNELELDEVLKKHLGIKIPLEHLIGNIVKFIVYTIAIFLALNQLGLTTRLLYIILIIIFVILIIFIVFALKDFIPNVVAGFLIYQRKIVEIGDVIKTDSIKGKVIEISFIETRIKTKSNDIIVVPNVFLVKNLLTKKEKKLKRVNSK